MNASTFLEVVTDVCERGAQVGRRGDGQLGPLSVHNIERAQEK